MSAPLSHAFTFRPGTSADAALLADLGWRTFDETFAAYNKPEDMEVFRPTMYAPEIQAAELADPHTEFLLVEAAGEAVAYVKWNTAPAPAEISGKRPFQISRLYLLKAWTGRGLGDTLMKTSLGRAQQNGHDVVWLTVWESNERAIRFYQKYGFKEVGELAFVLGADVQRDLYMQREV
ncbi:N-acetyltransferase family protein [Rufibacter glacialis]|uniref:GNAT family N-acetyltransferase n=1 Tax=Rufibacter glacialis TaxID=1259555 RepID=A0A5M8QQH1_9BACT|nr:N-acetyltransferase [Rufibacter glacialis]KAA6437244.1 GNAT family N-acetyltransferase [Rufibacter glacialis]GGK60827.1 N-acetyltransferase [Rufibacter glacialis]